jgi:hypothetical protein
MRKNQSTVPSNAVDPRDASLTPAKMLAGLIVIAALCLTIAGHSWVVTSLSKQRHTTPFIIESMLPYAHPNQPLTFTEGANRAALVEGWSEVEPWGVWSDGRAAYIAVRVQTSTALAEPTVMLRLRLYLVPPNLKEQRVTISTGARPLAALTLTQAQSDVAVPLKDIRLDGEALLVLKLDLPTAITPREAQNAADDRRLAVGIVEIELRP